MQIESHFENHKSVIEKELLKANKSALIAVAWINFKEYFEIFKKLTENSVKLKIICSDNKQNRSHQEQIDELIKLGAQIKLLKMPRSSNHMHHKFAIIDDITILNGSFNWSPNAANSIENISVTNNSPDEVTKFLSEFESLFLIESNTLKRLQKTNKCTVKGCNGELLNILVFSEKASVYYETYGDIIEVCNCCEHEKKIKCCISSPQIDLLLQMFEDPHDEIKKEKIERNIKTLLNYFVKNNTLIHAIGKVETGLNYNKEDFMRTKIVWKNKFVGDRIPDEFDERNFGVIYDQESETI